jgi:hypothetical protein
MMEDGGESRPSKNGFLSTTGTKQALPDIALVLVALGFQTWLGFHLGYWQDYAKVKWFAPDSQTFKAVANWLFGQAQFRDVFWSVAIRPIGYPVVLGLCERIAPWAIIVLQIGLWVLAQWALFRILKNLAGRLWVAFLLAMISVTCLTPAVLPFQVLSETLGLSLLAGALYFAHQYKRTGREHNLFAMLAMLSVATIVRPAGLYPFLIVLAVAVISRLRNPKRLLVPVACIVPVAIQIGIMSYHFGIPRVSVIDSVTVDQYLLSRADAYMLDLPIPAARDARRKHVYYTPSEIGRPAIVGSYDRYVRMAFRSYLREEPGAVMDAYKDDLRENMRSGSSFLGIARWHPDLVDLSAYQNVWLSWVGIILTVLFLLRVLAQAVRRRYVAPFRDAWFGLFVGMLFAHGLLVSGITYWQGDRLSLPVYQPALVMVGVWLCLARRPNAKGRMESEISNLLIRVKEMLKPVQHDNH